MRKMTLVLLAVFVLGQSALLNIVVPPAIAAIGRRGETAPSSPTAPSEEDDRKLSPDDLTILPNVRTGGRSYGREYAVMVYDDDLKGRALSDILDSAQKVADYGSYVWLELDEIQYHQLRQSGIHFEEYPDYGRITIGDYRFDPLVDGVPKPATGLSRAMPQTTAGYSLQLVQTHGPTTDETLAKIQGIGVVLQHIPQFAYLVWAPSDGLVALEEAGNVRWVGPYFSDFRITPRLKSTVGSGRTLLLQALILDDGTLSAIEEVVNDWGGTILTRAPRHVMGERMNMVAWGLSLSEDKVEALSQLPEVISLDLAFTSQIDDERSNQIVADNAPNGVPQTGYGLWLIETGLSGVGVTVAVVDTGIDWDHPDLGVASGTEYGGYSEANEPGSDGAPDVNNDGSGSGHGTHVAGIIAANASSGTVDNDGFLYGYGVAPGALLHAMDAIAEDHGEISIADRFSDAALNSDLSNNSWRTGPPGAGYTGDAASLDDVVLDAIRPPSGPADVRDIFLTVFSAGNCGGGGALNPSCSNNCNPGPCLNSITEPKEAKNILVVGSSDSIRSDHGGSLNGHTNYISNFSSRGPDTATDGRILPHVVAPGNNIISTENRTVDAGGQTDLSCSESPINPLSLQHAYCDGTSMATPHVSGAAALFTEFWRLNHGGENPLPSMVKAALINTTDDLFGGEDGFGNALPHRPDEHQGWGRINIDRMLNPTVAVQYFESPMLLTAAGDTWSHEFVIDDPGEPLRITLVWSDPPGLNSPDLINDLNLRVDAPDGNVWRASWENFNNGWSIPGGNFDQVNNVENVWIENPMIGTYTVAVIGTTINGDAFYYNGDDTDQHFSLVCYNCTEPGPPPAPMVIETTYGAVINEGEYSDIQVRVQNTGGLSDDGAISLSFPSFTGGSDDQYVQLESTTPDCAYAEYPNGSTIWHRDGYQFPANYLLVESVDTYWETGEENTLTIRVYPQQPGQFEFYVRSAMGFEGQYVNDPSNSGYNDQQGWEVYRYIIEVLPVANGLTLWSDTYSIPLDGSSVAHLTAHVTDGTGSPVVGELVTFDTNYTGGLNPRQDTTDGSGNAHTTFTPDEVGDAIVYATTAGGLSDQVTIDVYQSSGAIHTTFEMRLVSQSDTQSIYDIDGDSRYVASGDPVENTDIVYAVLGETGQPFGVLESRHYGTSGNPVTDRTDHWGDSSVLLTVNESQLVTIKVDILGSVDTTVVYVQVGPVDPADLQPFVVVGFPGEVTDLEMSPSGDGLVATSESGRIAQIMDPATYQFVHTLYLADDEEVFSGAFAGNGSRLAVGTDDEVVNIYNGTTYTWERSFPSTSEGMQFMSVDLSPDGGRVATGEQGGGCSTYRAPRLRIWNAANGSLLHTYNDWIGFEDIQAVDWSPPVAGYSSGLIAIGDNEGRIRILNGNGYGLVSSFWGYAPANYTGPCYSHYHAQEVHDLQWSPDGTRLAVGSDRSGTPSNILIFDRNGNVLNTLVGHTHDVFGLDWAHHSDRLISASRDGTLRIWDGTTGQLLMQFGTGNQYADVQWSADDTEVFAARLGGGIEVYSLVDSAGPTIQVFQPAEGSTTTAVNVDVIGQITDPHFVSAATVRVNAGAPIALSLDSNGNFTQNVTLAEGANTVTVEATDGCGNDSTLDVHVTRLVDEDPPVISEVARTPPGGGFTTVFQVTARVQDFWTGVDSGSVTLYVQHPDETNVATLPMYDDGVNGGDSTAGDEIYSAQWDASGAPAEGTYLLDIQAADMRGNTRHAENVATIQVWDSPAIANVGYAPSSPTDSDPVTVTAELTDFSGIAGAVLYYSEDNGGTWSPRGMTDIGGSMWRGVIPAQDQGTVLFKITANDPMAHSTTSDTFNYWVDDATAPTFYGWQRQPGNVTEDTVGSILVTVSLWDTGGSGLAGMTPEFDWHLGGGYDGWQPMTHVEGDTWSFAIPAQDWDAVQGQTLNYKARCADVAGNLGSSGEQSEFIDPINDAPEIIAYSPISSTLEILPGACQTFTVTAVDVDSTVLTTTWTLDGTPAGIGPDFEFCPADQDPHSLWATVTDGSLSDMQIWSIADDDTEAPIIGTPAYDPVLPSNEECTVTVAISDTLTGDKGIASATLSYGYVSPYNQHVVVGVGPGGNGDGTWMFTIASQGPDHEWQTLYFSITAVDGDNSPLYTVANNEGSGYPVLVSDDDVSGPAIALSAIPPEAVSTEPITITAEINDTLTGNHGVVSASLTYGYEEPFDQNVVQGVGPGGNGDGMWAFVIPPQGEELEGQSLNFAIAATDGDNSPESTVEDGGGAGYSLPIADDDHVGPLFIGVMFSETVLFDQPLVVIAVISDTQTGDHGVLSATLSYGYAHPYDEFTVSGTGPAGGGDGKWTFEVPPQGEAHCGQTLRFSLEAFDGDNSPAQAIDDNGGAYYSVSVKFLGFVYLPYIAKVVTPPDTQLPHRPADPFPLDGETNQPVEVTLSWGGGDPDGDSVTYDVYFEAGDSTPDELVCTGTITTSCHLEGLQYGTQYYWRVVATDEHGVWTTGPVWGFTTLPLPNVPPEAPSSPSPVDRAVNQPLTVTLSWAGGGRAPQRCALSAASSLASPSSSSAFPRISATPLSLASAMVSSPRSPQRRSSVYLACLRSRPSSTLSTSSSLRASTSAPAR